MSKCFLIKNNFVDISVLLEKLVVAKEYDLLVIDEISPKVDEINLVKDFLLHTSQYFDDKVLVFHNFDKVSVLNQNKLLKLIEENNPNTTQLYLVEQDNLVIDTVKSRLIFLDEVDSRVSEFMSSQEYKMFESAVNLRDYKMCYLYLHLYKYADAQIEVLSSLIFKSLADDQRYRDFKCVISYEKRISLSLNKGVQLKALMLELL